MTLHLDPKAMVWDEFSCLEPADPAWQNQRDYWEDYNRRFFQSNGLDYRPQDSNVSAWLEAEDRAPFVSMVEALLPRLADKVDLSDIDFVLLAHWMPDLHLGTSVTNFTMHHLGLDDGFGFAIGDRGLSAPLFATHCISKYLQQGRKRALLLVMDQKHLLYRSEQVDALQPANSACLMVLDSNGENGLRYCGYERRVDVAEQDLGTALCELGEKLGLDAATMTVIAEDKSQVLVQAQATLGDKQVLAAPSRLLCSAPFAALGQHLASNPDGANGDYLIVTYEGNCLSAIGYSGQNYQGNQSDQGDEQEAGR